MATTKPTKPNITLPSAFGTSSSNVKTAFTSQELIDGYSASIPQILDGGNVNWLNDTLFKYLTYTTVLCDWLNGIGIDKVPYINSSNQLDVASPVLEGRNNTFTGSNTFKSSTYISGSNKQLFIKATNITRNTAPSSNINNVFVNGVDSAGKSLWGIYNRWYTTKQNEALLIAYKGTTTDNSWAGIGVGYNGSGNAYTISTVQPSDTTTTSGTQIATTGWVNSTGNNVMHLTGDEIASGEKWFVNPIRRKINMDSTVAPDSYTENIVIQSQDKNDVLNSSIRTCYLTNGSIETKIYTGRSGTNKSIAVGVDSSGNAYTAAPTPTSATDNSTKIATTAWVNNHLAATTVKSTLVGYTIPDYQSGVSVAFDSDNKYTVPGNGVVVIRCDGSYDYFGGSISGQDIKVGGDFSSYRSDQFCVIPVLSGNIMGKSETHGSPSLTFYPAFGG